MQTNLMQCAAYGLSTNRLTPHPFHLCSNASSTRLFPKHNLWIWRWARALNFFGRPWRGLFWVEPVLLNRCMVLATCCSSVSGSWQSPYSLGHLYVEQQLFFSDPQRGPMHSPAPRKGYRAGPVCHDQYENCTVPPESEVLLSAEFSSPVPWHRLSRGGWGVWSPCSWNTPFGPPSYKEGPPPRSARPEALSLTTTRCCSGVLIKTTCCSGMPPNIQTFEVLRADLIHPRCLATGELLDYLGDFSLGDGRVHLRALGLCFLNGRHVGGIEEILEVFLPPSDDILSWGQQLPTSTENSIGRSPLPPPETLDGLPESLWGQSIAFWERKTFWCIFHLQNIKYIECIFIYKFIFIYTRRVDWELLYFLLSKG